MHPADLRLVYSPWGEGFVVRLGLGLSSATEQVNMAGRSMSLSFLAGTMGTTPF